MKNLNSLALFFLRLGLAAVFLYAAIAAYLNPSSWIGFFPEVIRGLLPEGVLLMLWGIGQVVLALWLLSGWKTGISALLASLSLLGIIVTNLGALDIIFRDVAIFFAAVALTLLTWDS